MNAVWALVRKDVQLFAADRRGMLIRVLVPIALAVFFSLIFDTSGRGSTQKVQVLIVDADHSDLTKRAAERLAQTDLVTPLAVDGAWAEAAVRGGQAAVAVFLPAGFGEQARQAFFGGVLPKVRLLYDPTHKADMLAVNGVLYQEIATAVAEDVTHGDIRVAVLDHIAKDPEVPAADRERAKRLTEIVRDFAPDMQQAGGVPFTVEASAAVGAAAGPGAGGAAGSGGTGGAAGSGGGSAAGGGSAGAGGTGGTRTHVFAGMALQGILFFAIDAAMAMLTDRASGIWLRLSAAPIGGWEIPLARLLSTSLISGVILAVVFAFGLLCFGISVSGSWAGLVLMCVVSSIMAAAFGLFVASLGRNEQQSRGLSVFGVLVLVMLGGAWFPTFLMPSWMQTMSQRIPVRWAVDGFDAVTWRGLGLSAILGPVVALLVCSLMLMGFAWIRLMVLNRGESS